ncbi:molybdopterin-binding protein [Oceanisphaera avium]|uniref:Molybdopterin-binding protein n=1 Tax=Oceanisphaera avium TaxID=1903694 RepID=A0A1Y0CXI6_9GAMM|nr:molybdopterin-binding protein [Oceanisphaera avium]ART79968.1 molybdopterin-binding protein [Oceanisphaera avium]
MKLLAGILLLCGMGVAHALPEPIVLTMYGDIEHQGQYYPQWDFTLSELQALPQAQITTAHPWSTQPHTYSGVDLTALLASLFSDKTVSSLSLEALNGFSIALDWADIKIYQPILAWQDNNHIMTQRNQGPLWLMLPFDQVPRIKQADFIHFMVWQLRTIKVITEPK